MFQLLLSQNHNVRQINVYLNGQTSDMKLMQVGSFQERIDRIGKVKRK
jgi:hypothetical protein